MNYAEIILLKFLKKETEKIVFSEPLLSFRTIREAYAHYTDAEEKSTRVQLYLSTKKPTYYV